MNALNFAKGQHRIRKMTLTKHVKMINIEGKQEKAVRNDRLDDDHYAPAN